MDDPRPYSGNALAWAAALCVLLARMAATLPRRVCTLQTDFGTVQNLADQGVVVGFNGTAQGTTFAAGGTIVNCPIVAFASP